MASEKYRDDSIPVFAAVQCAPPSTDLYTPMFEFKAYTVSTFCGSAASAEMPAVGEESPLPVLPNVTPPSEERIGPDVARL
ncbi:MAG TPA: hypothetical protein VF962_04850 [Gemmatimonadaceae bacterium]